MRVQSVHRNVFEARTCAHTVVTGLHKYICTIAQIQLCNCTNTCTLSSAVGQGSLAGNTGFVQASLHLQYMSMHKKCTWCDYFWEILLACASSWRRRLGSARCCAAWSRWASPWGWWSRRRCRPAGRSSPICSPGGSRSSLTGKGGWAGGKGYWTSGH